MLTRRSTLGISTLSVSERTAALRQTNNILQDIQAFEPMIQTVAASTSSQREASAPVSDIATKYQNLTKQAQELYDREKEMVRRHESFMEAGHEFMNWLRCAKDKLARCSEPTGDKDSLAGKIAQLKVLEGETDDGEKKLEDALRTAAEACAVALDADREIVEEEVALLQDEYDQYSEQMAKVKGTLEGSIVQWTDYQEMYQEALEYLGRTEEAVKNANKYQTTLEDKRKVLEEYQVDLQKVFDWQKDIDSLNKKGQALLQTCADSRVSNAITQLSTKYQALLSLAKDVMRRLEVYFQEHHQHTALCLDCQQFITGTRERLKECQMAENTHESLSQKLQDLREVRQKFDQGQNKLRYVLELKERVVLNTEAAGAENIEADTERIKTDFEELAEELQQSKVNLGNRYDLLGDIDKSNRLLMEAMEEAESKCSGGDEESLLGDLGEKRANLEKCKSILADLDAHKATVTKMEKKLRDHPNIPNAAFVDSIARFGNLRDSLERRISALGEQVERHEAYRDTYNDASNWISKIKLELQQHGDTQGSEQDARERQGKLSEVLDTLSEGDTLVRNVVRYGASVQETTNDEGRDAIKQDDHQLKYDWELVRNQARQSKRNMDKCVTAWEEFEASLSNMNAWIGEFQERVEREGQSDGKSTEDVGRRRELLKEANKQKYEMEGLGSVQQSRLSFHFSFQCCNMLQLLNSHQNVQNHLKLHFKWGMTALLI